MRSRFGPTAYAKKDRGFVRTHPRPRAHEPRPPQTPVQRSPKGQRRLGCPRSVPKSGTY
jgi:hypothetical protein